MILQPVLVSKCLMGRPCQYNGRAAVMRLEPAIAEVLDLRIIEVCPEQLAGLPTPRVPSEILGGNGFDVLSGKARVKNREGRDLTHEFIKGARQTLRIAREENVTMMITRRRSPSCGSRHVYDGSYTHRIVDGPGVTVALLQSKLNMKSLDLEEWVSDVFITTAKKIMTRYRADGKWMDQLEKGRKELLEKFPLKDGKAWEKIFREGLQRMISELQSVSENRDSKPILFIKELIVQAYGIGLRGHEKE